MLEIWLLTEMVIFITRMKLGNPYNRIKIARKKRELGPAYARPFMQTVSWTIMRTLAVVVFIVLMSGCVPRYYDGEMVLLVARREHSGQLLQSEMK